MIYVTGDLHGSEGRWMEQVDPLLKAGDTIIICGDFGVGFWYGFYRNEEQFYDWLETRPYTVLFCDGNHCNFERLYAYPGGEWNNGRVHFIRRNVIHLMRGEIYDIGGKKFFPMGGGFSMDRALRREGISWWPQEMPSQKEYGNARENLARHGYKVDYIITHTAPYETVYALSMRPDLGILGDVMEERELGIFLDWVQGKVSYRRWYFGHFHVDAELFRSQTAVFRNIRELETGRIVAE